MPRGRSGGWWSVTILRRGTWSGSLRARAAALGLVVLTFSPAEARTQLSDPCQIKCGVVLGAASVAVAIGTMVSVGRLRGGHSTTRQAEAYWTVGLGLGLGSGIALSGNGERQRRAVYAAGIGTLAGSLAGLAVESVSDESSGATRLAATLIGAAVGALAAGAYGAISYEGPGVGAPGPATAYVSPRMVFRFGF